jgi:histidinol-phosphate aminotransferase
VIAELGKIKDSYNCDSLAIAGATAAIGATDWLRETRGKIVATREALTTRLTDLGFDVTPSQANFVWCTHPTWEHAEIYEQLKRRQVLVRYMDFPDWGDGIRITVGTEAQIDALVSILQTL